MKNFMRLRKEVLDRQIDPLTETFSYLVRFKGYSENDDMWLPASSFNYPLTFASISS